MDNLIELILNGSSLQIVEIEEIDAHEAYIAVPFGFRSLPLIVASIADGKRVVCEDAWENNHMHHYTTRPEDYPENIATAQLVSLTFETSEYPAGITKFFYGSSLERLPQLHELDDGTRWETVKGIDVSYKVTHASGVSRTETLSPDYFIFEDDRGEYNVFYQEEYQTETAAVVSSACDAFIRPHSDFEEFRCADYGSEWGQDCLITQVEVNAAIARGDMREAMRLAARRFGVPITYVTDILAAR